MKDKSDTCPYDSLFIYHIDGIFSHEYEKSLGVNYIGNWVEDRYSFLFFNEDPGNDFERLLNQQPGISLLDKYSFSYEEWQGGGFEKLIIEEFTIVPPWEDLDSGSLGCRIILDPGVVFGNGLHPTTKDSIRALSFLKKQYSFDRVVDIGTGTGILAIAAACLGANETAAIDLNPLAVKTASNNVMLNNFHDRIKVFEGKAEEYAAKRAGLLIANIHFEVIKTMFSENGFLDRDYFIFSGLMRSQAGDLKDLAGNNGIKIIKEWDHEMTWHTILAGRV